MRGDPNLVEMRLLVVCTAPVARNHRLLQLKLLVLHVALAHVPPEARVSFVGELYFDSADVTFPGKITNSAFDDRFDQELGRT